MFYLHQSFEPRNPCCYLIMLFRGMRAWRDLRNKLDYMIESIGDVFVTIKLMQLTRDHDHESVRHANQL
jgi:hypothetical protein